MSSAAAAALDSVVSDDTLSTNPLLQDFDFPPFDSVDASHVRPGIRALLQQLSLSKFGGMCKQREAKEDDSDVLIECRDVYKSFGEKHILKGVSFKIRHGEAVGVIGVDNSKDMNKPEVLDLSTDNVPKDEATKPVKETELPESGTSVKSKTAKDNKTVKKKSDGVSLVADAAEHLERTSIHKDMDGQKDLGPIRYLTGKSPLSICSSGDVPLSDANMQFSAKLKLQLFPIDESTRRSLEMDKHNPHLELALNNRKKISSVLEHLNRKWGSSN